MSWSGGYSQSSSLSPGIRYLQEGVHAEVNARKAAWAAVRESVIGSSF